MVQRGNTAYYADAFVELFKIASMLDIWDKKREADIVTSVIQNDFDKFDSLSVKKAELASLHSEIHAALKDASCPDGVVGAVDEIFQAPFAKVGMKISKKKIAAKKSSKKETTVEMLEDSIAQRPLEITRVTETDKIKPKPPVPYRRNLDYGDRLPQSETSKEYFAKLNMSPMPAEEAPRSGYEDVNMLYSRRPNEDVNKKRFKQTQQGHKEDGVLIVPAYMNNGIMYRDDIAHLIMENVAKRLPSGLSFYVGAVPLDKEQLNNIGDAAMRLVMKDNDMVAKKLSAIIFTSVLNKIASMEDDRVSEFKKIAYNNHAFESHGSVTRDIIYPVRPESNILQYAHKDKMINIDSRSLSGVIMRADVKNNVLRHLSVKRPLGKTATELKVYYVKLLEAGGIAKAVKFKKACKDLYDVDCGDIDDKILDIAHDKSVTLDEINNALFPTQKHQQKIDTEASTSKPTGDVSDTPVHFAYCDINDLMNKYVIAKRSTEDNKKDISSRLEEMIKVVPVDAEPKDDTEGKEFEDIIPEGVEVLELGGDGSSKDKIKNISVTMNTNPDTGCVTVYVNGSIEKKFDTMEEAVDWAGKASEIINNVASSASDIEANFRFSDLSKMATIYNAMVAHFVKIATFSHNMNQLLGLVDDIM